MQIRARAAVLVVAALTLTACANVHPGDAAVVDGESISMKSLDKTAAAYCTLSLQSAKQQGVNAISNTDIRRQAVLSMASLAVARDLVKEDKLTIEQKSYELTTAQRKLLADAFPGEDVDALGAAIEDSQELTAIATALAEKSTGQSPTADNQGQFVDLGQAAILKAFADKDVQFAPRFGISPAGKPRAGTGSLSVVPRDLKAPTAEELPDLQRCS